MRSLFQIPRQALLGAILLIAAGSASADLTPVTEAFLAARIEFSSDGSRLRVYHACEHCRPQEFELDSELEVIVDGNSVPLRQVERQNRRPAAVTYDVETGRVIEVRWNSR